MFAFLSHMLMNCREKRAEEETEAVAMKKHCALSENRVLVEERKSVFTFFLKAEGLVSSEFLKRLSSPVRWQLDLVSRLACLVSSPGS